MYDSSVQTERLFLNLYSADKEKAVCGSANDNKFMPPLQPSREYANPLAVKCLKDFVKGKEICASVCKKNIKNIITDIHFIWRICNQMEFRI